MTPFAVDANAINAFQQERIKSCPGEAHEAIEAITQQHCIALDEERQCLQEWIDCAGGKFPFALLDWIADQAASGRVRYYGLSDRGCCRLLKQHGLPTKDQKWVRLAIGCGGRRLVSGDIDFFDPSKKNASAETKAKLRSARRGPLRKLLKKEFDVEVMCLEHVVEELACNP